MDTQDLPGSAGASGASSVVAASPSSGIGVPNVSGAPRGTGTRAPSSAAVPVSAPAQNLGDLWQRVRTSPKFQSLDSNGQEYIRKAFFNDFVVPQVPQTQLDQMRAQFDHDTALSATAGDIAKGVGESALNAVGETAAGLANMVNQPINAAGNLIGHNPELHATDPFASVEQKLEASKTPIARQEAAQFNLTAPATWTKGGATQWLFNTFGSVAPQVVMALATGGASAETQGAVGAVTGFAQGSQMSGDQERDYILRTPSAQLAQHSTLYAHLLAQGVPAPKARQATARAASLAGGSASGTVFALAGALSQALLHGQLPEALESTIAGRIGTGVAGQAGLMGGAQAAQNEATNLAIGGNRPVTQGVAQAAAGGALVGGAFGAIGGKPQHAEDIANNVVAAPDLDTAIAAAKAGAQATSPSGPSVSPDTLTRLARERLAALKSTGTGGREAEFLGANLGNLEALANYYGLTLAAKPVPGAPSPETGNVLGGHSSGAGPSPFYPEAVQGTPYLGRGVSGAEPIEPTDQEQHLRTVAQAAAHQYETPPAALAPKSAPIVPRETSRRGLPAPVLDVTPSGEASTATQRAKIAAARIKLGLTPDIQNIQANHPGYPRIPSQESRGAVRAATPDQVAPEQQIAPPELPVRAGKVRRIPTFIDAVMRAGGLSMADRMDTVGDTQGNIKIPGVGAGHLFTKKGMSVDGMVEHLAQHGWFTPDQVVSGQAYRLTQEWIKDEVGGIRLHYHPNDLVTKMDQEAQERYEEDEARFRAAQDARAATTPVVASPQAAAESDQTPTWEPDVPPYPEHEVGGPQHEADPFGALTDMDLRAVGYHNADEETRDLTALYADGRARLGSDEFDGLLERLSTTHADASADQWETLVREAINHAERPSITQTVGERGENVAHPIPDRNAAPAATDGEYTLQSPAVAANPQTPQSVGTQADLFGGKNETQQAVLDHAAEIRAKERNAPPSEAGPGDLFNPNASRQTDVEDVAGKPVRVDANENVPFAGGTKKDGTVVIDKSIPRFLDVDGKIVDAHAILAAHETAERAMLDEGYEYPYAHEFGGIPAEKKAVEAAGIKWDDWQHIIMQYVSKAEHEKNPQIAPDLDPRPYTQGKNTPLEAKDEHEVLAATHADKDGATENPETSIQDVGEKIGGARKDLSESTGARVSLPGKSEPGWRKRYQVSEIAGSMQPGEKGRWVVRDLRQEDWKGQPRQVGETFATREEAETAIPLMAVSRNHVVRAVNTPDGLKWEIWRKIAAHKVIKIVDQAFDTREDAMRYMAQHATHIIDTKTSFGEEILPTPSTVEREGPVRREGNVTGQNFVDTYGFRGVEFGNWENQGDRQRLMNHAYDALGDLAEVLKIPPRALSLDGDLALAFGARGHGLNGTRAHYERDYGVINLTKMKGAGSLAHEWFHALDHYLGRQDTKASSERVQNERGDTVFKASGREGDFVSHGFSHSNSGVRPELREAFNNVMNTLFKKGENFVEDTEQADRFVGRARADVEKKLAQMRASLAEQKDPRIWKRSNKPASAEQLSEFDEIAKRVVAGEFLNNEWRNVDAKSKSRMRMASGRWTNDALEKLSAIYKAVRGRSGFDSTNRSGILDDLRSSMNLYSARLKMLADAQKGEVRTKTVPTQYAMDAKEIDQGRASEYWTSPHEMAARAFQAYIEDKIKEGGGKSDFLVYGSNSSVPTPWGWKRPFPHGEERVAIDNAFDKLVQTIKTRETPQGVALFSLADEAANKGPRTHGVPPDAKEIHAFSDADAIKANPDYAAAKSGDPQAAIRLVRDLVPDSNIADAERSFGKDVIYVPVVSSEATGHNQIPVALAEYYAAKTGAETSVGDIVQANKPHHTGAGPMERLAARPLFAGHVTRGARYVLVDDVSTMGGTLAELSDHIQSQGAEVAGTVTLANASRSGKMDAGRHQIAEIERRYGNEVRTKFGIEPKALTRDEATYLLGFKDADALGNRATAAQRQRVERLRAKGIQEGSGQEVGQNAIADEPQPNPPAVPETNATRLLRQSIEKALGRSIPEGSFTEVRGVSDARQTLAHTVNEMFGKKVVFIENHVPDTIRFNGMVAHGDRSMIFIDNNTQRPFHFVVGHELLHLMRKDRPDLYNQIYRAALDEMKPEAVAGFRQSADLAYKRAGLKLLPQDSLHEEMIANFVGDNFGEKSFWDRLAQKVPGVVAHFARMARDYVVGLLSRAKGYGSNSYFGDLERMRDAASDALSQYADAHVTAAHDDSVGVPDNEMRLQIDDPEDDEDLRDTLAHFRVPSDAEVKLTPKTRTEAVNLSGPSKAAGDRAAAATREKTMPDWVRKMPPETQEALRKSGVWIQKKPLLQRFNEAKQDAGLRILQGTLDQFAPVLKRIGKYPYQLLRLASSSDAGLEASLFGGLLHVADNGAVSIDTSKAGLLERLKPLRGETDRFLSWIAGNRASVLQAEDREHLFGDTDIGALQALNRKVHATDNFPDGTDGANRPEIYASVLKDFNEFGKAILDIAEKDNLIDGTSRAKWEREFYVPFYREADDGRPKSPGNLSGMVNQYAFKRLTGGENVLHDLLANTVRNWSHLLNASLKNRAAAETLARAETLGAAHRVDAPEKGSVWVLGHKLETIPEGKKYVEDGETKVSDGSATVLTHGQIHYVIDDPLIYDAVTALEQTPFGGLPMKILGWFRHALTVGTTANPVFRVRHTIREQITALASNQTTYNAVQNWIDGFRYSSRDNPEYYRMLAGGSFFRMGYDLGDDRGKYVKLLLKNHIDPKSVVTKPEQAMATLDKAWDWWKEVGERSDSITRANLYRQTYDRLISQGGNPDDAHLEASYVARDAMDYGLHGKWAAIRMITQVVPFMNARMQGLYKLGRGAADDPKRFGAVVGGLTLGTIALALAYRNDPDYQQRTEWDRNNYWWFKVGDKAVRIPKPFELGALATVVERATTTALNGFDPEDRERFVSQLIPIIGSQLNINPVPQALWPALEVWANKNVFFGGPIENEHDQTLSKANRIGPNTTPFAQLAGKAGILSPKQIDFLAYAYFGWVGSIAVSALDVALRPMMGQPEQMPQRLNDYFMVGNFVKDLPARQSRFVTQFYDHLKGINQAMGDLRAAQQSGNADEMRNALRGAEGERLRLRPEYTMASRAMSRIDTQMRLVQMRSSLSADEKRQMLDRLYAERNAIAREVEGLRAKMLNQ